MAKKCSNLFGNFMAFVLLYSAFGTIMERVRTDYGGGRAY